MRESSWRNYEDETFCEICGAELNSNGECEASHESYDDLGDYNPEDVKGLDSELWQDRD